MTHNYIINILLRSIDLEDNIVAQIPVQVAHDLGDWEDLGILSEYLTERVVNVRNPYTTSRYRIVVTKPEATVDFSEVEDRNAIEKGLKTVLKQQLPAINAELIRARNGL
jgi:hypothetical protein